jgi:cleavage stimulation factor subunit 3
MDDMDAFLDAQKEYDPTADYSGTANAQPAPEDDEEEYDPSETLPSHPVPDVRSPSDQSASMPESAANTPSPRAAGGLKPQPAPAAAPSPSKQPRLQGGFVVESEDDEDEVPEPQPQAAGTALLSANGRSRSPQRSHTHSPNNTLPPTNVPVHSAQDLGHSGVSPSTSVAVNDAARISSPAVPAQGTPVQDNTKQAGPSQLNTASARPSTVPQTPVGASLPKPRLPQDRVGILEDRISEDPRGDIEAWLSLIEELRRRHKIDEVRNLYDRFFKVFPTAVSIIMNLSIIITNSPRLTNGKSW